MNTRSRLIRTVPRVLVGCLLALLPFADGQAEVGVALQSVAGESQVQLSGPYVLGIIVDDPDPQGAIWSRLGPGNPGRVVLNPDGAANGDGRPSVLFHTVSKLPIVSWARNSPAGFDIVVSRFVDGAWTAEEVVAGSSADELDPHMIQDPADGSVHLLYWIFDGSPRVMHSQASADATGWSTPVRISPIGEVASRPAAAFHEDKLRIVYESHGTAYGSTPRHIVMATDDVQGWIYDLVTGSYHGEPNWPEVHSASDKMWIDWVDGEHVMTWTRQELDGNWGPFGAEPFQGPEDLQYHVRGTIKATVLD